MPHFKALKVVVEIYEDTLHPKLDHNTRNQAARHRVGPATHRSGQTFHITSNYQQVYATPTMNIAPDAARQSSTRARIPPPRTESPKPTLLQARIVALGLGREPHLAGPLISLLISVEALHQVVSKHPELMHIVQLNDARVVEFHAQQTGEVPLLSHQSQALLENRDMIHDVLGLATGLLFLDKCLETIIDPELKREVEQIRSKLQAPLPAPVDSRMI